MKNWDQWERFVNGHWQDSMPQIEGMYPVLHKELDIDYDTDEEGHFIDWDGYSLRVRYNTHSKTMMCDSCLGRKEQSKYLWWSEPIPTLPAPNKQS